MKCPECGFEGPKPAFRYLYSLGLDTPFSLRQCPKCGTWLAVNDLKEEVAKTVPPKEPSPIIKTAGIIEDEMKEVAKELMGEDA